MKKEEVEEKYQWRVYFQIVNTFLESRAINYFVNLTKVLLASAVALSPDHYSTIAPIVLFFLIVVIPFLLGKSLHVVTVIGNRLNISDGDFKALWVYLTRRVRGNCRSNDTTTSNDDDDNNVKENTSRFTVRINDAIRSSNDDSIEYHSNPLKDGTTMTTRASVRIDDTTTL